MSDIKDRIESFRGQTPAWCPGCGNFPILKTMREALAELDIAPHEIVFVSGIGQAGKFPHYVKGHTFNGLHGRSIPVATGIKLVNHKLHVIAVAGDGDCYGEGGNHFVHAVRRNLGIKLFVHDNQIYALTKGQASPTTDEGSPSKAEPFGVLSEALSPMALAVALDASFAARTFAGDTAHMKEIIKAAMNHKGFTLVDILQPCVTFNKVNTYDWYRQRVYKIEDGYNPYDRNAAFAKALEWGDKIPIGIIYKKDRPELSERIPVIKDAPLKDQPFDTSKILKTLKEFY